MFEPFMINGIISYFDGTSNLKSALIYAFLLCFIIIIGDLIHHPFFLSVQKLGLKLRLSCTGLIYKKVSFNF
jgi:hypothetical protein